jgi:hypothetical protein
MQSIRERPIHEPWSSDILASITHRVTFARGFRLRGDSDTDPEFLVIGTDARTVADQH